MMFFDNTVDFFKGMEGFFDSLFLGVVDLAHSPPNNIALGSIIPGG